MDRYDQSLAPPHRAHQVQGDSVRSAWGSAEAAPRRPIRRDMPSAPPAAAEETVDQLRLRLAEELDYARRLIDHLGNELSADSAVVVRHSLALQSIDIVGQMLGHIANVVCAEDQESAVRRIGMCELKSRLTRRPL